MTFNIQQSDIYNQYSTFIFTLLNFTAAKNKHKYPNIQTFSDNSPRADDGKQDFTIDEQLISEFEELEAHQFLDEPSGKAERDCCNIYNKDRVWGLFGEEDTLAHFEPLFLKHYTNSHHFPGGHTPTAEQFKTWYCPLIEKLLLDYPIAEDRVRYFQHFKGNK